MTSELESALNKALALSPSQRAVLARLQISSIDAPPENGVEEAWLEIARKRLAELDSGAVASVSWVSIKEHARVAK